MTGTVRDIVPVVPGSLGWGRLAARCFEVHLDGPGRAAVKVIVPTSATGALTALRWRPGGVAVVTARATPHELLVSCSCGLAWSTPADVVLVDHVRRDLIAAAAAHLCGQPGPARRDTVDDETAT